MRLLAWLDALLYRFITATGDRVFWKPRESPPAMAPMDAAVLQHARDRINRVADIEQWPDTAVDRLARDVLTAPVSQKDVHQLRLTHSLIARPRPQLQELETLGRLEDPRPRPGQAGAERA